MTSKHSNPDPFSLPESSSHLQVFDFNKFVLQNNLTNMWFDAKSDAKIELNNVQKILCETVRNNKCLNNI